jgi:hypothetical protein
MNPKFFLASGTPAWRVSQRHFFRTARTARSEWNMLASILALDPFQLLCNVPACRVLCKIAERAA